MHFLNFVDKKFFKYPGHYFLQSLIAVVALFMTLSVLNIFTNTVVLAAIGSSAFIIFTVPHDHRSQTKFVLGGYIVGLAAGIICYYLMTLTLSFDLHITQRLADEIFSALSVGLSIFVMVTLDVEHPPAAGLALGLVLNPWDHNTLLMTLGTIIAMLIMRYLLRHYLVNLS